MLSTSYAHSHISHYIFQPCSAEDTSLPTISDICYLLSYPHQYLYVLNFPPIKFLGHLTFAIMDAVLSPPLHPL